MRRNGVTLLRKACCRLWLIRRGFLSRKLVLGIESTFDDSAAAVIDEDGKILGERKISQLAEHKSSGGVKPDVAMKIHEKNIPIVVKEAMSQAAVDFKDLSALATATRPGFALSLKAGLDFSKHLVSDYKLPFIPVHHMEAHALTYRMIEKIDFPFLVLLASGGHCLLCVAQGLGSYKILGRGLDEPPGAVFDKVARELGLLTQERFLSMSGGQAIEILARDGDDSQFQFSVPMTAPTNNRSCNFSFSGLQTNVLRLIVKLKATGQLNDSTAQDIATGFQKIVVQHIVNQIERGILFCTKRGLIPPSSTLVLSGGVAANMYFRESIIDVCDLMGVKVLSPPQHLCTDNGVMIAWTGMEYLNQEIGIAKNPEEVRYEPRSPMGEYIGDEVVKENIRLSVSHARRRRSV